MNRNNLFSFDSRPYQKHLSPFGQKVLNVLMNKWKKDRQSRVIPVSNYHYASPYQHQHEQPQPGLSSSRSGVLHFQRSHNLTDENTSVGSFLNHHENVINDIIESPNICEEDYNRNTINTFPALPTCTESLATPDDNTVEKTYYNLRTEDLIISVSSHNNNFRTSQNIECPKTASIEEEKPFFDFNVIEGLNSNTRKVGWDNMFDTELLDAPLPVTKTIATETNQRNLFEITFPNGSTTSTTNSKDIKSKKVSKKQKNDVETKPSTNRKLQSKVTDKIPKKIKKVISENDKIAKSSCFRKEPYTTTVKNWLDNVDPNKDSEEVSISTTSAILGSIDRRNLKNNNPKAEVIESNKSEIQIETKPKEKLVKKVVQAKLANKGGKMKFGKPTAAATTSPSVDKPEAKPIETQAKVVEKKEPKEKKGKPKFVAPTKSQVPVKDVSYVVIAVDDTNIEQCKSRLLSLYDYDIILVLIYSNGFCQLNNYHTEDTPAPEGVMLNVDDTFYYLKGNIDEFPSIIIHVLQNNRIICYEGKHILMYLATQFNAEIDFEVNIIDTKIGGSLLDPDNPPENFSELQKLLSSSATFTIATECHLQKSAWYVTLLRESSAKLMGLLKEEQLWTVFEDIEMKLVPIIADMESQGVIVDMEKLKTMETLLVKKMKQVEEECYKAAGKVFQITSSAQVRTLLYDELQLDARCNVTARETSTKGAKSTSEHMLRTLGAAHPLPALVLQHRQVHKAYSTFIAGVAHHVKDGVVKPTWVQNAAATGRIACNNPNLQAIPKAPFNLGTIPGEEEEHILHFRSIYLPPAGHVFLAADFRQVECRVWAHAAGDRAMSAAMQDNDLFSALAADWLGKPEWSVCSADRERTKRLVYASLYGAGPRKLADILQLSHSQTIQLMDTFYSTFPCLKSFSSEVVSRCAAAGRLVSTGGRRRLLPHITAEDEGARKHAERQAVNFIVQGSAADACKSAMAACARGLRGGRGGRARLALQLHDELVFAVREDQLGEAAVIIKQAMEGCGFRCGLPLRLPVSLAVGRDWAAMTPYQLPTHV